MKNIPVMSFLRSGLSHLGGRGEEAEEEPVRVQVPSRGVSFYQLRFLSVTYVIEVVACN